MGPTSLASVTLPHTCISMIERESLKIIKPIQIFTPVTDEATNYLVEAEQALWTQDYIFLFQKQYIIKTYFKKRSTATFNFFLSLQGHSFFREQQKHKKFVVNPFVSRQSRNAAFSEHQARVFIFKAERWKWKQKQANQYNVLQKNLKEVSAVAHKQNVYCIKNYYSQAEAKKKNQLWMSLRAQPYF